MKRSDTSAPVRAMVELLWSAPKPRSRGPKPSRSVEHLLDAAIGIADREGLAAVSMQRIAQELKFTKMAIYRYVPGRSELIALMTDRALGSPPAISVGGIWRQRIEAWALALFKTFLKHPWGLEATIGPRIIGPNEANWIEQALGILSGTGLNGADRLDVLAVAVGHLRSIAQQAAASKGGAETLESEMGAAFAVVLRGREADFPEFSRTLAELRDPTNISTKAGTWANNGLSFGLNCIFNGVEARATRNTNRIGARRRKS